MNNPLYFLNIHGIWICIFCGIWIIAHKSSRNKPGTVMALVMFLNALVMLSDIQLRIYIGSLTPYSKNVLLLCSWAEAFLQHLQIFFLTLYIRYLIEDRELKIHKPLFWFGSSCSILGLIGSTLSIWTGWFFMVKDTQVIYSYGFLASAILAALGFFTNVHQLMRYKMQFQRYEQFCITSAFFLPLLATIIELFLRITSLIMLSTTLSVLLIFICYLQYMKLENEEEKRQLVITQSRLKNAQIRPEFIFRSLSAIEKMIDEDPDIAGIGVENFASYLRHTLGTSRENGISHFQDEMEHVKMFMNLNEILYPGTVNISYEYPEGMDFQLPYLSIEPVIELAVRQHILHNTGSGSIIIRAMRNNEYTSVAVYFDGARLQYINSDMNAIVLIKRIRQNLQLLCKGRLDFQELDGIGTTMSIYIPHHRENAKGIKQSLELFEEE